MSRRIDPVNQVISFFQEAPLEQAATVLVIARGILARRQKAEAERGALSADEKNGRRVRSTRGKSAKSADTGTRTEDEIAADILAGIEQP